MPEFILYHGSPEGAKAFQSLDAFTQGCIEAAFFTETGYPENEDLENATVAEIAPSAMTDIQKDCADWQTKNAALLELAYGRDDYSPTQAGRDYWFSRNGHGVGFWDRDQLAIDVYRESDKTFALGDDSPAHWEGAQPLGELGDMLHEACRYQSVDMYRGDDGLIYFD